MKDKAERMGRILLSSYECGRTEPALVRVLGGDLLALEWRKEAKMDSRNQKS
jgi:hypothetical protein